MVISRRGALLAAGTVLGAGGARAQSYPDRPIRVIVPYAAGGADQYIRPIQNRLMAALGQAIVIESVTGGGGAIGANRVRNAAPDGYTLLFAGTGALTAVPRLQNLSYAVGDFAPIANLIAIPYVLAGRRDARFRDFAGLLELARSRPEGLSYGTPGAGSTPHLAAEAMAKAAGIRLLHVPYSGVATAVVALLAGDIDLVMGAPSNIMPLVERGVVPLVQTGATRIGPLPEVPTLRESGLAVELVTRFGFFAPKGTAPAILDRLSRLVLEAGADPTYAEAMHRAFNEVELLEPRRFGEFLLAEDQATARMLVELKLQ
ncbi:Bug family tripartite tricarboxylate transporter substrate binding protein [Roseomonas sp. BN140053]|uniref:Bug family tripartite tricarboxylate transporter substrate binding protein n=1 Tax=Roseomonas sp. BN140053 TaxID=3391898 RepID=UPI0039E9CE6F